MRLVKRDLQPVAPVTPGPLTVYGPPEKSISTIKRRIALMDDPQLYDWLDVLVGSVGEGLRAMRARTDGGAEDTYLTAASLLYGIEELSRRWSSEGTATPLDRA